MTARGPIRLHTRAEFAARVLRFGLVAVAFLALSLGGGVVGYRAFAGLSWVDALLNASLILTGMGPVDAMPDDRAKLFASAYAIFGGAVYPAVTAIILYPLVHRMMAVLHIQARGDDP